MPRMMFAVISVVFALVLIGCSKTENMNNSNSTTTTTEKPATSTPKTELASNAGDKIGVPECDDFIAKYESCTPKVPEMAREQYKSAIAQWKASWKKLAENPQTRGTLADACKQAAEQQAAAWKMYGCAQ